MNGTLNKLKNLITRSTDNLQAPTPNFALKQSPMVDQSLVNVQKEANRLQSIIFSLNSIFQKNGLQGPSG